MYEQPCLNHAPPGFKRQNRPYECPECRTQRLIVNPRFDAVAVCYDSNAGAIMAAVSDAIREGGGTGEDVNKWRLEAMSGNYEELLRAAMTYVTVVLPESIYED